MRYKLKHQTQQRYWFKPVYLRVSKNANSEIIKAPYSDFPKRRKVRFAPVIITEVNTKEMDFGGEALPYTFENESRNEIYNSYLKNRYEKATNEYAQI